MSFNLAKNQRAERKLLLTVAEWDGASHDVYTLVTTEPVSFDPTEYYKINASGEYVAGTSSDEWAPNTWYSKSTSTVYREILGTRTPESSIEYNPDIETSTDIRGNNFTDVNKTQPQQDFDPFLILGGSALGEYLNDIRRRNDLTRLSSFTLYVITAYDVNKTAGGVIESYKAEKHTDCTILYTSLGGDSNVNMPISAYFSNKITPGHVDNLTENFVFTADA